MGSFCIEDLVTSTTVTAHAHVCQHLSTRNVVISLSKRRTVMPQLRRWPNVAGLQAHELGLDMTEILSD